MIDFLFLAADVPIPAEAIIGAISAMAMGLGFLVKKLIDIIGTNTAAQVQTAAAINALKEALQKD